MIYRKKSVVLISILLLISFSCKPGDRLEDKKRIMLAIINPNIESLEGFNSLVENGIINIPGLLLIAVCYAGAEREFSPVENYIKDHEGDLFRIEKIEGDLNLDNLFEDNSLSNYFYHLFSKTNGIIFLGGADIEPSVYDEKTRLVTNISTPNRHYFELSFLFHLIGGSQNVEHVPYLHENPDYTVIGFCLGMQTMNVASGGSMYQDIPSDIYGLHYVEDIFSLDSNNIHRNYWQDLWPDEEMITANFHQIIRIRNHSFFDEFLWKENPAPYVYSSHHQALNKYGKNIEVIATSIDGSVPEIIAHGKFKNVIGVQFHPEKPGLYLEDSEPIKWHPNDSLQISYHDFLKEKNSFTFHKAFWNKVGQLFTTEN
jgi:putative glutamine amidotransferase